MQNNSNSDEHHSDGGEVGSSQETPERDNKSIKSSPSGPDVSLSDKNIFTNELSSAISVTSEVESSARRKGLKPRKPCKKLSKSTIWTIKITIITLCLAIVVSFITEITATKANLIISILLLCLLIVVAIIFDAVGVAATSCDLAPLLAMAARKIKGADIAVKLVKSAEKVANICNDVVGDMAGIISGACAAAIVLKFAADNPHMPLFNILISSIVAAVTVGGKAFFKSVAIKNSKDMIMFASKIVGIFYHPKKRK